MELSPAVKHFSQHGRVALILAFSTLYLAFQLTQIISAHSRDDKRFGFWMFAESTNFKAVLFRELNNGQRIRVPQGVWEVRSRSGKVTKYQWSNLVQEFHLGYLEQFVHAKTGIFVTLKYLEHALSWVIQRIDDDPATKRLYLYVQYSRAGGPLEEVWLSSKPRELKHGD